MSPKKDIAWTGFEYRGELISTIAEFALREKPEAGWFLERQIFKMT